MSLKIGRLVSRYWIVTLLPSFVATTIYVDYSYTRKWKQQQIQQES